MSSLAVVLGILSEGGLRAGTKVPNPIPARFVRVVRTGGRNGRVIDRPLLVFECWASASTQAEADAELVDQLLRASPDGGPWAGGWVAAWECLSIADNPDPDVPVARFTVTGVLNLI